MANLSLRERHGLALRGFMGKLLWFAHTVRQVGLPRAAIGVPEAGFGDQLLCTAVFRELRRRHHSGLWVMTYQPEIFQGNPDIDAVICPWRWLRVLIRGVGGKVVFPYHDEYLAAEDRWVPPHMHVIARMCELVGIRGPVTLRPYLTLSDAERSAGRLHADQLCIMSSGMAARHPMLNRQWPTERFQQVVDRLRGEFPLVQIGAASDPLLDGVIDRRGLPFRPTAGILANSLMFIGQEGFLAHLARAVDCRSVVVFGGFAHPSQTGYICNENLFGDVACAPCWTANTCGLQRRCLTMIGTDEVVEAVRRLLTRRAMPLATATVDLGAEYGP